MSFNLGQTFYVDKQAVQKADQINITSVDLYFRAKPIQNKTESGINNPGVTVAICATKDDGSPDLTDFLNLQYGARVEYENINADSTGTNSTTFVFKKPIQISTNRSYAFVIKFDGNDRGFEIFANKAGTAALDRSAITQVSSGNVDGYAYRITNGSTLTPLIETDLAFKVNLARFTSFTQTYQIQNRAFEFLKVTSVVGAFKGGEEIIQERSSLSGNVVISGNTTTLVGNGTSFTSTVVVGDNIIITDGTSGNTDVRVIGSVTNATHLVLTEPPSFSNTTGSYFKTVVSRLFVFDNATDELILQDSTANSTVYLTTSTVLRGIDSGATATISQIRTIKANAILPNYAIKQPTGTKASITINLANTGGSLVSSTKQDAVLGSRTFISEYDAVVDSRSNEVTAATPLRSFSGEVTFTTSNPFSSPSVSENDLDLFVQRYDINNDATNEYNGKGLSKARYISRQINLSQDQTAEDFKVYLKAFRPPNSDIKVYVKLYNPEDIDTFDIKDWTEMELEQSADLVSNPAKSNNYLELTYKIPFYQSGTRAPGQFTTQLSSAVVTGTSGSVNTDIKVGDLVLIQSPLFEENHVVDTVVASNTSTITIGKAIANSSIVGSGFNVTNITRKNSGFLDIQNNNVLTYFNTTNGKLQGFQTFAVKIVLLSSDGVAIPYVDNIRALAVSA